MVLGWAFSEAGFALLVDVASKRGSSNCMKLPMRTLLADIFLIKERYISKMLLILVTRCGTDTG